MSSKKTKRKKTKKERKKTNMCVSVISAWPDGEIEENELVVRMRYEKYREKRETEGGCRRFN